MVTAKPNAITAGYAKGLTDPARAAVWCERYARRQYENFTVVSWFLPRRLRGPMFTLYAFCRFTDDLGDSGETTAGDRLALLDEWETETRRAFEGEPRHPIGVALAHLRQERPLEIAPFLGLIEANRRDQRQTRYATFQDVLDYCELSANTVGQMVLAAWGYSDEYRRSLSDATCTALQLANHWQDVVRDLATGRLYLPQEDLARFGVSEEQIADGRCDDNFRALLRFEVDRAEALFRHGERLRDLVPRDLQIDLDLFTAGGRAVLQAIARQDYDVLRRRPVIGTGQKGRLALRALARRTTGL